MKTNKIQWKALIFKCGWGKKSIQNVTENSALKMLCFRHRAAEVFRSAWHVTQRHKPGRDDFLAS